MSLAQLCVQLANGNVARGMAPMNEAPSDREASPQTSLGRARTMTDAFLKRQDGRFFSRIESMINRTG